MNARLVRALALATALAVAALPALAASPKIARTPTLPVPPTGSEDGPEAPASPRPPTGSCRVACAALPAEPGQLCATLSPGSGATRDDSADIIECLRGCGCVQLTPDPATGNLKFLVRQSIAIGGMNKAVKLRGSSPSGGPLPLLKATGTCAEPFFIQPFTDSQGRARKRYKPVLDLNRAPGGEIRDLRIKVADYKQSCQSHTLRETFAVNVDNSPKFLVRNVTLSGQAPALNLDSGAGIVGGIQISFSPDAILQGNKISDLGYAIGDDPDDCLTASGVAGIKVADSANSRIDNNDVIHSSFGIGLVNENAQPNGNTSSGSWVTNNRITGAAGLHCELPGAFTRDGKCALPATDKLKIRCSQGRALRFEGNGCNILRNACAENNYAVQFGGREGQTNGSGLDLSGYVQNCRLRNNVFDGTGAHVEFTFQPRAVADFTTPFDPGLAAFTVNNIVQGNVFVGADRCDVNFQSLGGSDKQVVADQCGITHNDTGQPGSSSGNNRFSRFTSDCGQGKTAPGACTRSDVPTPPPFPALPSGPPPVDSKACTATTSPAVPMLTASPQSLTFSAAPGAANPPSQTLAIGGSGGSGGALSWSASTTASFLTVSPTSGRTPGSVTVAVNVSGLAPNTYKAAVLFCSGPAGNSPLTVPVTLVVAAPPAAQPRLTVSPTSFSFQGTQGGANPPGRTLAIGSTAAPLAWTVTPNTAWLALSATAGTTPGSPTVSVHLTGLAAGTYSATLTVAASGAANSPIPIPVSLTVSAGGGGGGGASLLASPASLSFSAPQGGPNALPQLLAVASTGAALSFTASSGAGFVTVSPTSVTTPATLTVSANVGTLAAGTYNTTIQLVPGGGGTPAGIPVSLTVTPAPPPTAPTVVGFSVPSGSPGAQVQVAGTGFSSVTAVTFAGSPAAFTIQDATHLLATVPNVAPTCGRIAVTNAAGSGQSPDLFAITPAGGGPVICNFTPLSGRAGDSLTLRGGNFINVTGVAFNGVPAASFFTGGASFLGATVPAGATTGRITVTTASGSATSPTDFVVTP